MMDNEGTQYSEGTARDLGGLTQESGPQVSQSLLQREPTLASQASKPECRPNTSKPMISKCKHSGSRDNRPRSPSPSRGCPREKNLKRARGKNAPHSLGRTGGFP